MGCFLAFHSLPLEGKVAYTLLNTAAVRLGR